MKVSKNTSPGLACKLPNQAGHLALTMKLQTETEEHEVDDELQISALSHRNPEGMRQRNRDVTMTDSHGRK